VGGTVREHGLHPAIDKTYPLTEAPEAVAYLGEGHAKTKDRDRGLSAADKARRLLGRLEPAAQREHAGYVRQRLA
jgi:hypothetical protein